MPDKPLHVQTPVIENSILNARLNKSVYLKMECFQPSGSFKMRGIGHLCQRAVAEGAARLVTSSGGNAGYTAAYVGRLLGAPVTVVVPQTASELARERIAAEGAELIVHGVVWDEADKRARQIADETGGAYLHPFDDPHVWEGHATLIDEAVTQCPKPDAVVVSVGGGGLLSGVVAGMQRNGWGDVPVIAVETHGADSFATALRSDGRETLPAITSIATTLASFAITPRALEWARQHPITPAVVTDRSAVTACLRFADDQRVIVEPACGASLALLYDNSAHLADYESVLIVVCGGAGTTMQQLQQWAQTLP